MTKILHISKFFYPYYGGIEDMALTIVNELKDNFDQKVFCFNHQKGSIAENIDGVDIIRVGTIATFSSQPLTLRYQSKLSNVVESFKPDFIYIHFPNPLAAVSVLSMKDLNAKIILHWHADILNKAFLYTLIKPFEKKIVEKAYKIICTSSNYAQSSPSLKEHLNKTIIMPSTIDEKKLKLNDEENINIIKIREKYQNKKIVFFVGRHVPYKGIDLLIEAEKFIQEDCSIVIAGFGELTTKLKHLCKENNRIFFVGKLSNNDLKYYMYASCVFAFPSVNRSEAFGLALAEALYCGLPAVSFNIEGSGSVWVNQNNITGFVVENKNVKGFAEAIDKILVSDFIHDEFAQNAQEWVKNNFLKEKIIPTLNSIYT